MPMKPLPDWISSYEPKMKDSFKPGAQPFWGLWVDANGQGLGLTAPYSSNGTTGGPSSFGPLGTLAFAKNPAQTAQILASAWQAWYLQIKFSPSPPSPPFSVITAVVPSSLGVGVAYSTLLSGLIAQLAVTPPDPTTAFQIKATAFGTLFYTATNSAGAQITGMSLSAPPAPLVLPLVSVM